MIQEEEKITHTVTIRHSKGAYIAHIGKNIDQPIKNAIE